MSNIEETKMTDEAFNELIDNFEVVGYLTKYGRKAIKQKVKEMQSRIKELESKLEEANKQLDLDYVDENYIPKQKVKGMQTKIKELEEENGKLRIENAKLRVVRVEYEYGYENTHFITKNNLIQIDRNKYLIEVEEGKFVDVKQLYYESIPKQKVKDVVEEAIEIIDSELFKVIMGDVTKVTRLRYLLKNELLEEGE